MVSFPKKINTRFFYYFLVLDFTHTLSCPHYVIACGMLIKTVLNQESTTRLIHRARPATTHVRITLEIHSLPLLTHRFFNGQLINVSVSLFHLSLTSFFFFASFISFSSFLTRHSCHFIFHIPAGAQNKENRFRFPLGKLDTLFQLEGISY